MPYPTKIAAVLFIEDSGTIYWLKLEWMCSKKNFINFRFQLVNCQLSQICRKGCIVNVFFTVNAVFLLVKTIYYVIICHHKFVTIHLNVQYAFSSLTQKKSLFIKKQKWCWFFSDMHIKTYFFTWFVMIDVKFYSKVK